MSRKTVTRSPAPRPDLQTIFGSRQRKPRSAPLKSVTKTVAKETPASIVKGDLLDLIAARVSCDIPELPIADRDEIPQRPSEAPFLRSLFGKRIRSPKAVPEKVSRFRFESNTNHGKPRQPQNESIEINGSQVLKKVNTESSDAVRNSKPDSPQTTITTPIPTGGAAVAHLVHSDILTSSAPMAARRLTRAETMMASARIPNSSANLQDRFIRNNVQVPSEILKDHEPISIPSSEVESCNWAVQAERLIAPKLSLPARFETLKETFKAMETAMNVHKIRHRSSVPFDDLAFGVQSITKKTFTRSLLAQIVHLFPHGYSLHNKVVCNSESGRTKNILAITLIELSNSAYLNQLQRNQQRLHIFQNALLKLVFDFYLRWIKKKHPDRHQDIELSGIQRLQSWYPGFPVDQCPSVPRCILPTAPVSVSSSELARMVGVGPDSAICLPSQSFMHEPEMPLQHRASGGTEHKSQRLPSNDSQSVNIPSGLEGVPLSLIHRVHMKEAAAREAAAVIGTRQSVQDDLDLESLPDFVVLVHAMFSDLRKPSMLFSAFIAQLKFKLKHKLVSEATIMKRVGYLLEFLPSFCQRATDGRIEAFRVDLNANVAHLRAELRYAIKLKRQSTSV